jgi:hypothetical protein
MTLQQIKQQKQNETILYFFLLIGKDCADKNNATQKIGNQYDLQSELEKANLVPQFKSLINKHPHIGMRAVAEMIEGYNLHVDLYS